MPRRTEVEDSIALVEAARARLKGELVIDMVIPDYYARYPKPCAGGWGRIAINVSPSGKALPCHAAESIPGLEFWNVRDHSLSHIWQSNPAFRAFRGTDWMREPCRTCERREIDWGGCRCQALALTGDARNADPACHKSPDHERIVATALAESEIRRRRDLALPLVQDGKGRGVRARPPTAASPRASTEPFCSQLSGASSLREIEATSGEYDLCRCLGRRGANLQVRCPLFKNLKILYRPSKILAK